MKFAELLAEYQIVPVDATIPDFTDAQQVGTIQTDVGPLQVWRRLAYHEVDYAATDPATEPATPAFYIGFQTTNRPTMLIARTTGTDPAYQGKGIAVALFQYVNKVEKYQILSGSQLTAGDETLWKTFLRSPEFSVKIAYIPTGETFDLTAIGTAKTQDGETVMSPQADTQSTDFYDVNTKQGQRFFYLIK